MFKTASGQPINADSLAKHFKSILGLCGLPPMRLYDLRHSAATIALAAGAKQKNTGQDTRLTRHSYLTSDWMPRTIIAPPVDGEKCS